MYSIRQLKKYLGEKHHISIKSNQTQQLRNLGYYHGYKGYRFIKKPSHKIIFSDFAQVSAVNEFDMQLKSLFYSKVMFIETALKNYVIESVLRESKSENIDIIFNKALTHYRVFTLGSSNYKNAYTKRMQLKGKINNALLRDYGQKQQIVKHFFDADKPIPIWAIFESLTLGEFGNFYSCCNLSSKLFTSDLLKLPKNLNSDGKVTEFVIYTIKDLRNAVAHNNIIFDTRFRTGLIDTRLSLCLQQETGINYITFNNIEDYVVLIVYVLKNMGVTKTECKQFARSFLTITETLRSKLPISMHHQIISTGVRPKMMLLETYISEF